MLQPTIVRLQVLLYHTDTTDRHTYTKGRAEASLGPRRKGLVLFLYFDSPRLIQLRRILGPHCTTANRTARFTQTETADTPLYTTPQHTMHHTFQKELPAPLVSI